MRYLKFKLLFLIWLVFVIIAACQPDQDEMNRTLARDAGVPDWAFKVLNDMLNVLDTNGVHWVLASAQKATDPTNLNISWDSFSPEDVDEAWCMVTIVGEEKTTWHLAPYRVGDDWFEVHMTGIGEDDNEFQHLWEASGCTNW